MDCRVHQAWTTLRSRVNVQLKLQQMHKRASVPCLRELVTISAARLQTRQVRVTDSCQSGGTNPEHVQKAGSEAAQHVQSSGVFMISTAWRT
jgi:hypothetical protein